MKKYSESIQQFPDYRYYEFIPEFVSLKHFLFLTKLY